MRLTAILFVAHCLFSLSADAATRIELIVNEPFGQRSVPWPVTTGVPFPRGGLVDAQHCRLVDDTGEEQVLQSKVAATWDAERTSIRWLTIDFIALPGRKYALEFGPDVKRQAVAKKLVASAGEHRKLVDSGVLKAELDVTDGWKSFWLDLNGDGKRDPGEHVASGITHHYSDQWGQRFDDLDDAAKHEVVVEVDGPVRACVRVDGYYTKEGDRSAKPIVAFRTRYHFFKGLPLVKAVDEFRIQGSTRGLKFEDIGIELDMPSLKSKRRVAVDAEGTEGNQVKTFDLRDDVEGGNVHSISSYQTDYRHFGNPECRAGIANVRSPAKPHSFIGEVLHQTDRIGEWVQLQTDRFAVTGSMRWMWQQFPKEWVVGTGWTGRRGLTLHLWSPSTNPLDFGADGLRDTFGDAGRKYLLEWNTRGTPNAISNFFYYAGHAALKRGDVDGQGINKHHEFWFHFTSADKANVGAEYGRLAAKQPLALASGEWNCSTDVFGPLMPRGPKSQGGESVTPNKLAKYEGIVDRLFDLGQEAQDTFGDYGWWIFGSGPHYSYQWDEITQQHYADPRRFEYHTYQKETQLWWNYFRSGERKFHDWAVPSEDHWVDIATTHVPLTYRCDWRGGFRKPQTLQMRPGDWSIDSPLFYVRQRDSAEAWLRGCSQFQASYHRTLETTALAYYLTGDERYNDVLKFWQDYWRDFAGKTSASDDWPSWLREQPWFVPSKPGQPHKTWAEMIRDYCPFTSGLRHQMTYFFSLSTLYEHTWDPVIGQVVRECADAYLDPEHRMGVWRTQENGGPAYADAPELAHFWVPALWKYARATQDPRMPRIFQKYFDACYAADPFRENVGRYSDVHLGYAYYYMPDPKHLRSARLALDKLLPNAEPLARPQDLGRRLYNPYAPIQCFTAVPRLMWALDAAKRDGVATPPPTLLGPQRAAIALPISATGATHVMLWGFDEKLEVFNEDGQPLSNVEIATSRHASEIQPFDRVQPDFTVYLHEVTIPPGRGNYALISPRLELAVLSVDHDADQRSNAVLVNAASPLSLESGQSFRFQLPAGAKTLKLESATPTAINVTEVSKKQLAGSVATFEFEARDVSREITISSQNTRGKLWFRIVEMPAAQCWGTFQDTLPERIPGKPATQRVVRKFAAPATSERYARGRFGEGLHLLPGRELRFADHLKIGERIKRLVDRRQGTIEFFIKQLHDTRLVKTKPVTFLTNGEVQAFSPRELPLQEWAHVAVEWRPLKRDPNRIAVHVYINGLDRRNYRSTWWEGYSQKPLTLPAKPEALGEFICSIPSGTSFVIDEIRISNIARYAKLDVELGGQQVFNPATFTPRGVPFVLDRHTVALLHLDGKSDVTSALSGQPIPSGIREIE